MQLLSKSPESWSDQATELTVSGLFSQRANVAKQSSKEPGDVRRRK